MSSISRECFFNLLDANAEFEKRLLAHPDFISALCAIRPDAAGLQAKTSGLYWIFGTKLIGNFFNLLGKNLEFKEQLIAHPDFISALCAIRPYAAGLQANTSGLYWILRSKSIGNFLNLFKKNRELKNKLFANFDFVSQIRGVIKKEILVQKEVTNLLKFSYKSSHRNTWNIIKDCIYLTGENKPSIKFICQSLVVATKANKLDWLLSHSSHPVTEQEGFFDMRSRKIEFPMELDRLLEWLRENHQEETAEKLVSLSFLVVTTDTKQNNP